MNREERRNLAKCGVSQDTINKLNEYDKPCTLLDVVRVSQAIAEDVADRIIQEYKQKNSNTIISLSLNVEMLKKIIIEKNIATDEELRYLYEKELQLFQERQEEMLKAMTVPEGDNKTVSMTSSNDDLSIEVDVGKD